MHRDPNTHSIQNRVGALSLGILIVVSLAACNDLGVEGGANALATRFSGVQNITVLSPTAVMTKWTPQAQYDKYEIFISTQDAPIGSTPFSSWQINGLKPDTPYSFSVAGLTSSGNQDGISTQLSTQTWPDFSGPISATAIDSSDIQINWNYFSGPTYDVYYNIGSPPSTAQVQGTPNLVTQNSNGVTVGGLLPNTTYYFSVVAAYQDGTTSLTSTTANATTLNAQFTWSNLVTLPAVTTSSSVLNTEPPQFTISGGPSTYVTTFYQGSLANPQTCPSVPSADVLTSFTGNGTATASAPLPSGSNIVAIQVKDPSSGACAYASFSGIESSAAVTGALTYVTATTPTSLTPLPTVTAPAIQLGSFPSFTVAGSLAGYKTTFYYGATQVSQITGDGTATTYASTPLPQGDISIQPVVTYGGQSANLAPVKIHIKMVDATPYVGPSNLNGGTNASPGLGQEMVTGDFNCDGYPDLAVSAPNSMFSPPDGFQYQYQNGAVIVYYGTASGLDIAETPSTTPTGTHPLLIPDPNTYQVWSGAHFGNSLAAGSINKAVVSGHTCSDLVVGAPYENDDGVASNFGAFFVYYGSPTGLQTGGYSFNTITCSAPNGYACGVGKYSLLSTDTPSNGLFGSSVAVGDFNGDGYDDVAVSAPEYMDSTYYDTGAVYMYYGTANGLSPTYTKITVPPGSVTQNYTLFGRGLAFGYVSDSTHKKKDLIISLSQPSQSGTSSGFIWVQGTSTLIADLDATGHLIGGYGTYTPPECLNATCATKIETADVNGDGYDDVLFSGTYLTTNGRSNNGAFFVYYGSASGPVTGTPTANTQTCTTANSPTGCTPQYFYRTSDAWYNLDFATSLTNLGDTNGDGYPDIGVGAQGWQALHTGNYTYNGAAYVYYGGPYGMGGTASFINLSSAQGSLFGTSMAGANFRDINYGAQTYNDVVVGAPGESGSGLPGHGRAHIFYNSASGLGSNITSDGGNVTPEVGSLAKAVGEVFNQAKIVGDINGDGYADVAATIAYPGGLGSRNWAWDATTNTSNAVIVYYGSPNGLITTPSPTYVPLHPTDPLLITDVGYNNPSFSDNRLGGELVGGDFNGDGFSDLIVNSLNGHVYLFYGASTGLITQPNYPGSGSGALDPKVVTNYAWNIASAYNWCGYANPEWLTVGDFNGDGFADLAVMNGLTNARNIYVIYGSSSGLLTGGSIKDQSYGAYATEPNPYNRADYVPHCTGTWPNAQCQPLTICSSNTANCSNAGSNYAQFTNNLPMYPGAGYSSTTNNFPGVISTGPTRIEAVGDVDGDGTDDLVAIDPSDQNFNGGVFIFYGNANTGLSATRYAHLEIDAAWGNPSPPTSSPLNLNGTVPYGYPRQMGRTTGCTDWVGGQLSRAYDINGDGVADFVVGADQEDISPNKYTNGGAAYLIYGITGGYQALGPAVCASYPCTVSITNTAVADGIPTHVVDEVDNSCDTTSHRCDVLRFYPSGTNLAWHAFGFGTLGLGDITGDGFADIAVDDRTSPGHIYVFSGGQSGLQVSTKPSSTPTCSGGSCTPLVLTLPIDTENASHGINPYYEVNGWSEIGDVDGDHRPDFLISSYYLNDPAGTSYWNGGFYLFH